MKIENFEVQIAKSYSFSIYILKLIENSKLITPLFMLDC